MVEFASDDKEAKRLKMQDKQIKKLQQLNRKLQSEQDVPAPIPVKASRNRLKSAFRTL